MSTLKYIKVMLVDDHAVVRAGYRFLLSYNADIKVVAEADSGRDALEQLNEEEPDVIVLDLTMPDMHGLELLHRLHARGVKSKVLVFTMHENPAFVEQALQSGASGYLSKNSPPQALIEAIRTVASGKVYIDANLEKDMVVKQTRSQGSPYAVLTNREFQILCLFGEGRSSEEIASRMSLSTKTIANYLTSIKDKLKVQSTQELVHLAISDGLVTL